MDEDSGREKPDAPLLPPEAPAELVEDGVIPLALLAQVVGAIGDGDRHALRRTITELHPADAADLLEALPPEAFRKAIHLLDADLPPEAVAELADEVRIAALEQMSDQGIVRLIGDLDSDDASFIIDDLEEDRRARILGRVSAADRAAIESSLAFDEESAGRLMQRDFVAAPVFWTVGQAIDHMRAVDDDDLPETFFEIFIVDPAFRLQGSVPVSTLLRSARDTPLKAIMKETRTQVRPEMDQEEVAYLFQQYNLASAPVVDDAGRLTGMITVDDIVDVMQEENREDILALSGVNEAGVNQTVFGAVKARIPWLAANLVTAFAASAVVALFQGTIEEVVALAILMPVVAGLCGNAGSQALTVTVRAIAERDLEGPLVARAVRREGLTALINGVFIASAAGIVASIWFRDAMIGVAISAAMVFTFLCAGLIGILTPLAMKRMGADPAVASAVFVLTLIDLTGFFAFLGLATLILL
jgi:magnesium transporter